jgi:phospholipid/cholesterol/gamma-HCH transport system ATP-binding protein
MLRISGLAKSFGDHAVLRGVDLVVEQGKSLVIIGGSGTGKSVTLKCIMGFIAPDAGSIELDGQDLVGLDESARTAMNQRFGLLFQHAALLDSLPVWENTMFAPLRFGRLSRRAAKKEAGDWLQRVGIDPAVAFVLPGSLSVGMQKRIGLARAIAAEPEVLLFDEPTTGLDAVVGRQIDELIRSTIEDLGATAITITHDITSAQRIGDHVAMLYEGKTAWQGEARRLMDSGHSVVDQFVHGRLTGPIPVPALPED